MLPLLVPFRLRWLEEAVIPDDIHGYTELMSYGRIPIAWRGTRVHPLWLPRIDGESGVNYIQFDTNRVGGITQVRKIVALAEGDSVPVILHAGQMHSKREVLLHHPLTMHKYHVVMDPHSLLACSLYEERTHDGHGLLQLQPIEGQIPSSSSHPVLRSPVVSIGEVSPGPPAAV